MIDTHVHVVAADTETYPHAPDPPFATTKYVHDVEDLMADMRTAGVTGAALVQPFGIYGTDNSYQLDAARRAPDRFVGICGVSNEPDAPRTLRYWITDRGMDGGRIITLGQGISLDDPGFLAVCREAERLEVPLCVLTSRKHVADLPRLATRVPNLRIVLDHLGVSGGVTDAGEVIDRMAKLVDVENIYLKISTPMLHSGDAGRRVVEFVLDRAGAARVLWGTNYPVTDLGGYAATVEVSRKALAFLSTDERERVVTGTARELWPRLP
ncbi:MAG TPA: amidohydrolase family protein [Amycolatopsis sp.]|nr:amidohydrolase family protein [Amycolatopsis sp.]